MNKNHIPSRPSHHPLVAFLQKTGDLMGLQVASRFGQHGDGRRGVDPRARGATPGRRSAGCHAPSRPGVLLERAAPPTGPAGGPLLPQGAQPPLAPGPSGTWRLNGRAEGAFSGAEKVYSATGEFWGFRLLALQGRCPMKEDGPTLKLGTYEVTDTAHTLTNVPGIHALTAWRCYNAGAVVEQRIEELGQHSVGQMAVDDRDGNRLLWALGGLAYQMLPLLRTTALSQGWRGAQPKRIRVWLLRMSGCFTTSSSQLRLHVHDPRESHS